jgi:hypothetical protein
MCWLALVAEMLLLEAALVKSKLGGVGLKLCAWGEEAVTLGKKLTGLGWGAGYLLGFRV